MRPEAAEQRRQKLNLIRLGTVAEVDFSAARCRVSTGELKTDWIPWLVPRVSATVEWSAPSIGEQGLVLCPDGDTFGAVFVRGIYSDAVPAPSSDAHVHMVRFPDGTVLTYNDASHALSITIASGGTVDITAAGGVTVNADVQVNGTLTASEDCIGGGISLKTHTTTDVTPGTGTSGPPQ